MMRLFIFSLILVVETCCAQIAKDDFASINAAYKNNKRIAVKIKYDVFKSRFAKTPLQSETGEFKRSGNLLYSKIGNIETVDNDQYMAIVDNEDKTISLLGKSKDEKETAKQNKQVTELYQVNLEKMLSICSKVEFKPENEEQNSYRMEIPDEEYEEIKVFYNKKTFFIDKVIFYYRQKQDLEEKGGIKENPRLEITYSNMELQPTFGDDIFTYNKFLEKSNGKWRGKATYKGYEINDHLLTEK